MVSLDKILLPTESVCARVFRLFTVVVLRKLACLWRLSVWVCVLDVYITEQQIKAIKT